VTLPPFQIDPTGVDSYLFGFLCSSDHQWLVLARSDCSLCVLAKQWKHWQRARAKAFSKRLVNANASQSCLPKTICDSVTLQSGSIKECFTSEASNGGSDLCPSFWRCHYLILEDIFADLMATSALPLDWESTVNIPALKKLDAVSHSQPEDNRVCTHPHWWNSFGEQSEELLRQLGAERDHPVIVHHNTIHRLSLWRQ